MPGLPAGVLLTCCKAEVDDFCSEGVYLCQWKANLSRMGLPDNYVKWLADT